MTAEKKQKVLMVVLGVLVLGAGSVWYVTRDGNSGGNDLSSQTGAKKTKRVRDTTKTKKTKRASRAKRDPTERAEKSVRERTERKASKKSRRGKRGSKIKKKKKSLPPAAYLPPMDDWHQEIDPHSFRPRFA